MTTQVVTPRPATADIWIDCKSCGSEFLWSAGDQQFYLTHKITAPKSCRDCRERRKNEAELKQERIEAQVSGNHKQAGVIKSYNAEKGYGFISRDGEAEGIFFHVTSLRCDRKLIRAGVRVEFYEIDSPRKKGATCAERVTVAESENGEKR